MSKRYGTGDYESSVRGNGLIMLVVGCRAVDAWVLLVISNMGWLEMEVVDREHVFHSQDWLATQRDISEHFRCAWCEYC